MTGLLVTMVADTGVCDRTQGRTEVGAWDPGSVSRAHARNAED